MTGEQNPIRADAKGRVYIGTEHAHQVFEQHLDGTDVILRPAAAIPQKLAEQMERAVSEPASRVKRGRPSRYDVTWIWSIIIALVIAWGGVLILYNTDIFN